jgi:hypothetical protein
LYETSDAEHETGVTTWLMLMVALPAHPSSMRVRARRRLRALGAVALKNSVWVLPFSPEGLERLQWLTQEVQKDRGEATLVRVDRIENLAEADVVRLFHQAREADYRGLAARYRASLRRLGRRGRAGAGGRTGPELGRLGRELDRVRALDFFDAPGYQEVDRLRAAAEMHLRPPAAAPVPGAPLPDLRGRLWATRPRPHIDRLASAWLIRRFIDPDARFLFAPPAEFPPEAISFDVVGAELGHHGDDCTFETLLKRRGLDRPALRALAEIVHEADLRDGRYDRAETDGIDLAVRGLATAIGDDQELVAQAQVLFDGIYGVLDARGPRP